ncbi:BLUF domain-containing protein [Klebsiella variicola subsp. variicola]|nr:BLUF domain-containing protein [Klebsiella variicola subsp. variicola]
MVGSFFQVLEGNEEILESLFSKIQFDPRHRDVVELMPRLLGLSPFSGRPVCGCWISAIMRMMLR